MYGKNRSKKITVNFVCYPSYFSVISSDSFVSFVLFFFGQVVTLNLNKIIDINYYPVKEVCFENFNFYRWFSVNISSLQVISNLLQIIADCILYVLMILHTYFISNNLMICIIIFCPLYIMFWIPLKVLPISTISIWKHYQCYEVFFGDLSFA